MFVKMKFNGLMKKVNTCHRKRMEGDDVAAVKEVAALLALGKFYLKHQFSKKFPHAFDLATESYRNAAMLGDKEGQYLFADQMIKKGNFWNELSQGIFRANAQTDFAKMCYEQAFKNMHEAIEQDHPLAKRLLGLCKVKGWGTDEDSEAGTKLIIQSIKDEGKWDKATEIFEGLGLKSPDLFSSLMKHNS